METQSERGTQNEVPFGLRLAFLLHRIDWSGLITIDGFRLTFLYGRASSTDIPQ